MDVSHLAQHVLNFVHRPTSYFDCSLDLEKDGADSAVESETPETILMSRSNSQLVKKICRCITGRSSFTAK